MTETPYEFLKRVDKRILELFNMVEREIIVNALKNYAEGAYLTAYRQDEIEKITALLERFGPK